MSKGWSAILGLAVACLALAGCDDGGAEDETAGYHPAVDVNGPWRAQLDGSYLGVMNLQVSLGGSVTGTLVTLQGATAQLSGAMNGYGAEFTVVFPAERYLAAITFTEDAANAVGSLLEDDGSRQTLALTRQAVSSP